MSWDVGRANPFFGREFREREHERFEERKAFRAEEHAFFRAEERAERREFAALNRGFTPCGAGLFPPASAALFSAPAYPPGGFCASPRRSFWDAELNIAGVFDLNIGGEAC